MVSRKGFHDLSQQQGKEKKMRVVSTIFGKNACPLEAMEAGYVVSGLVAVVELKHELETSKGDNDSIGTGNALEFFGHKYP